MGQLNFYTPMNHIFNTTLRFTNGTLIFGPISPQESISWNILNLPFSNASGSKTLSIGLYSLNGGTLSLANSASRNLTGAAAGWLSITDTSATQNITPGNWWLGIVISTSGTSNFSISGATLAALLNAFPGGFIGGRMTDSTNALPSSYVTSDLDTTGNDAIFSPNIILSA